MVAVNNRIAKAVAKYGMRYGPLVFEAVRHGREPAQRAVERALAKKKDRRQAFQHAAAVIDGSVLETFHDGAPVWVVFSSDVPVASYPKLDTPLPDVLQYANLDVRQPVGPESLRPLQDRLVDKLPLQVRGLARKAVHRHEPVDSDSDKREQ